LVYTRLHRSNVALSQWIALSNLDNAFGLIGYDAHLVVLLVTFPIALLQGASQMAILSEFKFTGRCILVTDFPTPYLPTIFSYGTAPPTTSLVIITLV
jgi:hypothetical protein